MNREQLQRRIEQARQRMSEAIRMNDEAEYTSAESELNRLHDLMCMI